jgi:predicted flap endonuclease-1-like 5' DNA nuclease
MEYLAIQVIIFLLAAVMVGGALGWWGSSFTYQQREEAVRHELAGLRRNYGDAVREKGLLRIRLKKVESALRTFATAPSVTDYGEYVQTRKALENARRQHESLLEKLHKQQRVLEQLRKQLEARNEVSPRYAELSVTPQETATSGQGGFRFNPLDEWDDLTHISGVDSGLARKLRALGIVSYQQLAEFTAEDVLRIQPMLDMAIPVSIEGWRQEAFSLFQQKQYPPLA